MRGENTCEKNNDNAAKKNGSRYLDIINMCE